MGETASKKRLNLMNIGPRTEWMLEAVGVHGYDELNAIGSVEAYKRLRERFPGKVNLNALYALEAALWHIHWLELLPEIKEQLKAEL
ncbi:TfoX/Sxy family DNA transformation protein [Gorillibacterium sp. sgz5001074]|uniref:TfoX/Sxy family DNA transformation protein n=1 Tax=Gorillibacterium sp. sgz5001074 TaxID=3446695 RepID=UPI003F677557